MIFFTNNLSFLEGLKPTKMNQRKDKIGFRSEDQSGVIQADLLFLEFSTVGWVFQQQNKKATEFCAPSRYGSLYKLAGNKWVTDGYNPYNWSYGDRKSVV